MTNNFKFILKQFVIFHLYLHYIQKHENWNDYEFLQLLVIKSYSGEINDLVTYHIPLKKTSGELKSDGANWD